MWTSFLHSLTGSLRQGLEEGTHVDVESAVGIRRWPLLCATVVAVLAHLGNHDTGLTTFALSTSRSSAGHVTKSGSCLVSEEYTPEMVRLQLCIGPRHLRRHRKSRREWRETGSLYCEVEEVAFLLGAHSPR